MKCFSGSRRAAVDLQHSTLDTRHPTLDTRHPTLDTRHPVDCEGTDGRVSSPPIVGGIPPTPLLPMERSYTMRRLPPRTALIVLAALATPLATTGCTEEPPGPSRTEILWDEWGVPHVYAPGADSLLYAYGWAQMEAHGDRILRLYGEARGRAAEYWGPDHLSSDRLVRTLGLPERGRGWADAQAEPFAGYLESFVAGMNAYAEAHADRIDDAREAVLPVTPADVFAHTLRAIHVTFIAQGDLGRARRWGETARAATGSGTGDASDDHVASAAAVAAAAGAGPTAARAGSNAWAVAPSRSADGNAMLLANPHLPWGDLFTWFEAQLVAPGLDAYGAALIGMPFPGIAFNLHLGWTHTVNTIDAADLYRLRLRDGGYAWDGEVRTFEADTAVLRVKGEDGSLRPDTLIVRRSVHGPVVARNGNEALAIRIAGLDAPGLFGQYWRMLRATSLEEFEAALRELQMPMFNVVYADREGHILYLFGGRVPERNGGDWSYWQGVVPGDTSATLWTSVHPYDDLPRVLDPPSGWVQNANDPPFTSTFPGRVDPTEVPAYLAPRDPGFSAGMLRPQRSIAMVSGDSSITFEELVSYKNDTRMGTADRLLDDLIPAAREHGDERARRAADVLEVWDRTADGGSRGGVLFAAWFDAMLEGGGAFATPYDPEAPRTTPDGLADPRAAARTLGRASEEVEARFGSPSATWGDAHRLAGPDGSYPASGGDGVLGLFRVLWFGDGEDGTRRAVGGDSYVAVTEFTPEGPRARAVMPYGNASRPGSPHRGDQMELYADKRMRPVWLSRDSVEAHLESRTTFPER